MKISERGHDNLMGEFDESDIVDGGYVENKANGMRIPEYKESGTYSVCLKVQVPNEAGPIRGVTIQPDAEVIPIEASGFPRHD